MGFRDELTSLAADAIDPGTLPAGVLLPATQITAGNLDPTVVAQALTGKIVGSGNLKTGAVTADAIAANAIVAGSIAAGAIDGMTITGATLQTAASGNRVQIDEEAGSGVIALYSGQLAEGAPAKITQTGGPVTASLALDSGAANGSGHAQLTLAAAQGVGLGTSVTLDADELEIGASTAQRVDLNGNVYRADKVHWEWTGQTNESVGSGAPNGVWSLTKDAAKSIGTGPGWVDLQTIKPGADGIYAVSFYAEFAVLLSGRAYIELRVNGATAARAVLTGDNAGIVSIPNVSLAAADAILPVLYQSNGVAVTANTRLRLTLLERI